MVEGPLLLLILVLAILFIILATSVFKLHPFLALILVSFAVGFSVKMPSSEIIKAINQGFGGLMTYIGLVIVFGTIIGTVLEKSGGAYKIADVILTAFGEKRPALAMSLIGAVVSIPVFCDSGFVILSSLNKAVARKAKVPLATLTIALASGLYATHTLVPPTPGPIAAAGNLGASDYLGTIILIGLFTSIPAILTGYWWALKAGKTIHIEGEFEAENHSQPDQDESPLPSALKSFSPIVLPILLISIASVVKFFELKGGVANLVLFIGNPVVALLIGVLVSFTLMPQFDQEHLNGWIGSGVKQAGPILLITGAGGAFGSVLKATPLTGLIESIVSTNQISGIMFILLAFIVAAALKSSQGSSTAALVITSSLLAPMLAPMKMTSPVDLALIVMAIGGGAMTVSHANDSYFWVVTQFSGMKVNDAYRSYTVVTLLQGLIVLLTTIIFYLIYSTIFL